jgi:membrane protein involved in colicin uptake
MAKQPEPIRGIEVLVATAVNGQAVDEGAVLLIPEDITEDSARALMRMARPRAKKAAGEKLAERLASLKAKAEADAKAQAEADAKAKAEADAKAQAEADAKEGKGGK